MTALLLILPAEDGDAQWLLHDGEARSRGMGLVNVPEEARMAEIVLVAPGEHVVLRWLEFGDTLSSAQAQSAARLMLESSTLGLGEEQHFAVGPAEDGKPRRCVGVVAAPLLEDWLDLLERHGMMADRIIPEPLLLLAPAIGWRLHLRGVLAVLRTEEQGLAIEPELATLFTGDSVVETIDDQLFEAMLPAALAAAPLDLRQGRFARRKRPPVDRQAIRRIAMLGIALLFVTITLNVADLFRHAHAAGRLEREAQAVVTSAEPGELAASSRGSGGSRPGWSDLSTVTFAALRETPNAELAALDFANGTLTVTVRADTQATFTAFADRIRRSGHEVQIGAVQQGGTLFMLRIARP